MLPSGNCGKQFIGELARLFNAFTTESVMEGYSIKVAMTMSNLLLQKPHSKSKCRDHITCLKRRFNLWKKGKFQELVKEGKSIQRNLRTSRLPTNRVETQVARKFSKLMRDGKV